MLPRRPSTFIVHQPCKSGRPGRERWKRQRGKHEEQISGMGRNRQSRDREHEPGRGKSPGVRQTGLFGVREAETQAGKEAREAERDGANKSDYGPHLAGKREGRLTCVPGGPAWARAVPGRGGAPPAPFGRLLRWPGRSSLHLLPPPPMPPTAEPQDLGTEG